MRDSVAPGPARIPDAPKLWDRSPLLSFLCREFGRTSFGRLLDAIRREASASKSVSMEQYVHAVALAGKRSRRFGADTLLDYAANIADLSRQLRMTSDHGRLWMPHQYLALLFVERYFDRYFKDASEFCRDLNLWKRAPEWYGLPDYRDEELRAFVIQSAAGSGKTPLMYANILQYRHYLQRARGRLNNILLLTPSDEVSEHHEREARTNRLRARRFHREALPDPYRIVDTLILHQFATEEVTVDMFGDHDLVVVDEGHTGRWGRRWTQWRAGLMCRGAFIIEFGHGYGPEFWGTETLRQEYSKNLLFHYSFRDFHADGYGKKFTNSGLPLR